MFLLSRWRNKASPSSTGSSTWVGRAKGERRLLMASPETKRLLFLVHCYPHTHHTHPTTQTDTYTHMHTSFCSLQHCVMMLHPHIWLLLLESVVPPRCHLSRSEETVIFLDWLLCTLEMLQWYLKELRDCYSFQSWIYVSTYSISFYQSMYPYLIYGCKGELALNETIFPILHTHDLLFKKLLFCLYWLFRWAHSLASNWNRPI